MIHKEYTKVLKFNNQNIENIRVSGLSLKYSRAKRGIIKLNEDHIEFKDWKIPYSEISKAELYSYPFLFTKCYTLLLQANNTVYEFGVDQENFGKMNFLFRLKENI